MRKIFTFLFAALMSAGMWADPNIVTPTISGDLSFTESTTVTMECTSPNSDIYYTTDGITDPRCDCEAAPEYKQPITITETTIIKAAAYDGNDWSAVAEVTFTKVPASDPADEYAEIVWTEVVAKEDLAEDATFAILGTEFSATIADEGDKMEIDANTCRFGTAEDYKSYTHRLKSGGASSSTKNYIMLNIPEAGTLRIAPRTGSNTATDRALVITQGETELYNAVVQESQAITVTEDGQEVKVYPYVEVPVVAGSVRVSYSGGMNFYSFGFAAESAPTTYTLQLVADPEKGSVAVTNLLGSDIIDNGNGNYTVPANAEVTILATPNEGYEFSGWKVGNIDDMVGCYYCGTALNTNDNPMTITMTEDIAYLAEFAEAQGIENIVLTEKAKKVVVDGMVYIVRDGKMFDLTGVQVK